MKKTSNILWVSSALLWAVLPAAAQWLEVPSMKLPLKKDGSVDLDAPAPRTAWGKPDFSGVWESVRDRPCAAVGCDVPLSQEFVNIGFTLKGGLPYQPWAAKLVEQRRAGFAKDDPGTNCRPLGAIKLITAPFMRKIVQTSQLLVLLSERDVTFRQIFLDGRPLPKDPNPNWNGYSVGHWEGDTLVVESAGFHDDTWLDVAGSPLTEAATLTERIRRPSFGILEMELTVNDPKAYTKPWTIKLNQQVVPRGDLLDYFCTENERDRSHMAK